MSTAAIPAFGLQVTRAGTQIPEVVNCSGPNMSADAIEVTQLLSPGACKEFIKGLLDNGEVTLELNYLPGNTNQQVLLGDLQATAQSEAEQVWTIVFTDSGSETFTFNAFPTALTPGAPVGDKLAASCTLKITGELTSA